MTSTFVPDPNGPTRGAEDEGPPSSLRRPLTRSACLALLKPGGHGRVAATMRAIPVIIPVSFRLLGEDVAFSPQGESSAHAVKNSVAYKQSATSPVLAPRCEELKCDVVRISKRQCRVGSRK